ncbi:DUF3560 domain-containing protein [Streptomyces sp. NPDC020799]|uniref:DUF3560 domain-containing protein n=1 Tax=Streptomyces sp. NPDC020799 TaxID=3365091 RepID=UPI00346E9868
MNETMTKGEITITHTRADGTLVDGSRKGDGVFELIRPHGFRFFRSLGQLGIARSRDRQAQNWKINAAAAALRAAGWTVTIEINEDIRRSFDEAETERAQRAVDRAERYDAYSDRAVSSSQAHYSRSHEMADAIPMGQPILVGHHSEGRDRRYRARIHDAMGKSIAEGKRAEHWADRAETAARYKEFRDNPPRTLRRIEKLQADLRRVEKWQAGESAGGYTRDIGNPATVAELKRRHEELSEQIAYWQQIIKTAEEEGFKVWSSADFKKGDFVHNRGTWYEVLRVNKKSVTIPHIHNGTGKKVVRADDNNLNWTWLVPYDEVSGRKSAEEMRELLKPSTAV